MPTLRVHSQTGAPVIVLHGGPAAVGEAAPIACGLADAFRVLEPWQRGSGGEPLTVAEHIADLHEVVATHCAGMRPALVGESWGAMLALAYAAAHPEAAGPMVLIGCGTFDPLSRARLQATLDERTTGELRQRLDRLADDYPDPAERHRKLIDLTEPLYQFDPLPEEPAKNLPPFDWRAHAETWNDMLRLQGEGMYPAAFAAITSPVLMLHGAYDPHPGPLVRDCLQPHLLRLEYHEWERCGHSPWREKAVRKEFFTLLRSWLRTSICS